jgi:hypothetical protein
MIMNLIPSEFQREPTVKNDIVVRVPFINGGQPQSAIRPIENLRNRYYASSSSYWYTVPTQAARIARTNPPVKAATSPVTLSASGMGSTYRLTDEALRQYSLGSYLHNMATSYYQTRP